MSLPYVIRILVTSGDPDGVRVVDKSNWTGRGVVFSRADLPAAIAKGVGSPGVYVLIGEDPEDGFDQRIYIGQGEDVGKRLAYHLRDDAKEFWTDTVVFVSASQSLNRAHILHLEARLVELAHEARRASVANSTRPNPPVLPAADEAEAEGFLAEMLAIYPVLGVDAFDRPAPTTSAERRYFLDERGGKGEGVERSEGFFVFQGATARIDATPSFGRTGQALRERLLATGELVQNGDSYRLTADVLFKSPSAAAGALIGAQVNGREAWRDAAGVTLKAHQTAAAGPTDEG